MHTDCAEATYAFILRWKVTWTNRCWRFKLGDPEFIHQQLGEPTSGFCKGGILSKVDSFSISGMID